MAKKAEKPEKKRLEIKTRTPGKPSGIFDNIGQNRGEGPHPLREILGAHASEIQEPTAPDSVRPASETVDAHTSNKVDSNSLPRTPTISAVDSHSGLTRTPAGEAARRPLTDFLDVHHSPVPTPTSSQDVRPLDSAVDTQQSDRWTPETGTRGRQTGYESDAQPDQVRESHGTAVGRPPTDTVDTVAPSVEDRESTQTSTVDTLPSTAAKAGAHRSRDWTKVESMRTTGRFNLRPSPEIERKIRVYCVERKLDLTEFFMTAGLRLIELDAHSDGPVDAKAPYDDRRLMMLFKTKTPIINLYLAYTARFNEHSGNAAGKWAGKWLARDDEAAHIFNDVDIKIIELGIIQTQANKGIGQGKIQTFKYYVDEIQNVLQQGMQPDTLKIMVEHHRTVFARWFGKEIDLGFLENNE